MRKLSTISKILSFVEGLSEDFCTWEEMKEKAIKGGWSHAEIYSRESGAEDMSELLPKDVSYLGFLNHQN